MPGQSEKVIAYRMRLPDRSGASAFLGTTPKEVGEAIANHLEDYEGNDVDDIDAIRIEAYETTQHEIDNLPDFPGW